MAGLLLACSLGVGVIHTPQSVPKPRPAGAGHIADIDSPGEVFEFASSS